VCSVSAENRSLVRGEFFHFATPFVALIGAARVFFGDDVKCKNNKPAAANTLSRRKLFAVSPTNCFADCKNVSAPFFHRCCRQQQRLAKYSRRGCIENVCVWKKERVERGAWKTHLGPVFTLSDSLARKLHRLRR
jgi:hypothetical protein